MDSLLMGIGSRYGLFVFTGPLRERCDRELHELLEKWKTEITNEWIAQAAPKLEEVRVSAERQLEHFKKLKRPGKARVEECKQTLEKLDPSNPGYMDMVRACCPGETNMRIELETRVCDLLKSRNWVLVSYDNAGYMVWNSQR